MTRAEWERPPGPDGGGVRRLGRPPVVVREEITASEPGRRHAYRVLSGQPVRSCAVEVVLTPTPAGTVIDWSATVEPRAATGALVEAAFRWMLGDFARRLAVAAAR